MIDQHMHCIFSPGSETPIEEYVKLARDKFNNEYVNLTDHCDITKNVEKNKGVDFEGNFEKIYEEVLKYNGEVKMGIEMGYNINNEKEITDFLNLYEYSLVLLSIHDNDVKGYPYSQAQKSNLTTEEVLNDYFSQVKAGISSSIDFDILSHLGYIFRYLPTTLNPLDYKSEVSEILKLLIERDKILEINTACVYKFKYDGVRFYKEVLKLYKELGGFRISLGSDAHDSGRYCDRFDEAIDLIKSAGFNELTIVKDRQYTQIKI